MVSKNQLLSEELLCRRNLLHAGST